MSLMTGTACLPCTIGALCAGWTPDCGTADAGSGASGCSLGTGMTGVPIVGIESAASAGFDVYVAADTRNAVASGIA